MKIVIEFYRTRGKDDAHAVVGRETDEVADVEGAIELALRLSQTLDLPQRPDGITITDADGRVLYSGDVDADALYEGRSRP
ncbi:hypothetical protein [Aminobacter ciceronei]|uniref:Uncharacterized protein n=1 Tax=Aminobacter ciceronei TaxID=150723 RepID=A0ABR6C2D8_9HYPH|nr:hypothetical protein [Aminobacter ciceronei]MBA8905545.1 hypothetical protein [Aminobacter ciceronei]MBA9019156.1 hypothetical protein [Aminobacter ciceronei]